MKIGIKQKHSSIIRVYILFFFILRLINEYTHRHWSQNLLYKGIRRVPVNTHIRFFTVYMRKYKIGRRFETEHKLNLQLLLSE